MMRQFNCLLGALAVAVLAGCGTTGTVARVAPGPGKTMEQFVVEDRQCRQFATLLTAAGAYSGELGSPTAATIAALSGAYGMSPYGVSGGQEQAYEQCMYFRGNQINPLAYR